MSPVYVVRTMIRALGNSLRMPMIASMPFRAGICRSINVTSGRCNRNFSIASCPLVASAISFMSHSALTSAAIPWRRSAWSSAVRIRIGPESVRTSSHLFAEKPDSACIGGFRVGNGGGNCELNLCACCGFAPDIQSCPYLFRTFTDPGQPPVSGAPAFLQDLRVHALSIIPDTQAKLGVAVPDLGFDLTRLCVLERVS